MHFNKKYALAFSLLFLLELLIALFVRDSFIRPFIGDVLVIVLMYCFIKIFLKCSAALLPLFLFLFAAAIEFGQYFHFLKLLRLEHIGFFRILLGNTFDIKDIFCYLIGTIVLFCWQDYEKKHRL